VFYVYYTNMVDKLTEAQVRDYKEAFFVYDQDADGFVSTKDLGNLLRALGRDHTEAEIRSIIAESDPKSRGIIDFPEFLTIMAKKMDTTEADAELRNAFKAFDVDKNGYIHSNLSDC